MQKEKKEESYPVRMESGKGVRLVKKGWLLKGLEGAQLGGKGGKSLPGI